MQPTGTPRPPSPLQDAKSGPPRGHRFATPVQDKTGESSAASLGGLTVAVIEAAVDMPTSRDHPREALFSRWRADPGSDSCGREVLTFAGGWAAGAGGAWVPLGAIGPLARGWLSRSGVLEGTRIYVAVAEQLAQNPNTPPGVLDKWLLTPQEVMDMVDALSHSSGADRADLMARLKQLPRMATASAQLDHVTIHIAPGHPA